jgi:hypothetical protein
MFRLSALITSLLAGLACQTAHATAFAVDKDVGPITVAGSITTDGTPGTLAASNIEDWDLNVTFDSNAP